jgi:hypothetical protein
VKGVWGVAKMVFRRAEYIKRLYFSPTISSKKRYEPSETLAYLNESVDFTVTKVYNSMCPVKAVIIILNNFEKEQGTRRKRRSFEASENSTLYGSTDYG